MKYDTSIHMNPDANAWAKFFMQTMQDKPNIVLDEGLMTAWFANAMMAMHDHLNGGPINGDNVQHIAQQATPKETQMNSYATNNVILGRTTGEEGPMFVGTKNGDVLARLDRYLIVPLEQVPDLDSFIKSLNSDAQAAPKELTEEQIYWLAESHGIRMQKGLIGFYRDLVSTTHIGNVDSVCTSQERVEETAKSEQVPLTDALGRSTTFHAPMQSVIHSRKREKL